MTDARLVLVRHGVTDWNREGRFQGHLDPPLGDEGRREASLVAERLVEDSTLRPLRVISSSLGRAMETAAPIAARAGVDVEPDARLIEIGQGRWEGRTHAELAVTTRSATRPGAARPASGGRPEASRSHRPSPVSPRSSMRSSLPAGRGPCAS